MNTSRERLARRAAEMLRDGMAGSIPEAIGQAMASPGEEAVRRPASNRCVVMWMPWKWPAWDWRPGLVIEEPRLEEVDQFLATLEFYLDGVEMRIAGKCAADTSTRGARPYQGLGRWRARFGRENSGRRRHGASRGRQPASRSSGCSGTSSIEHAAGERGAC